MIHIDREKLIRDLEHQHCDHCGQPCGTNAIHDHEHLFCCEGCSVVYDLLRENDLCGYYNIDGAKGISPEGEQYDGKFSYLDLPEVFSKIIAFTDGKLIQVNWLLPKMHCSSCIWLLEQLQRLHPGIRSSVVNFPEKTARITFEQDKIQLSQLATLLCKIGYEPYISLDDLEAKTSKSDNRTRLYKIGIAGFAFGNIMMLSFPEYFSLSKDAPEPGLRRIFDGLNLLLSLPVFFYCALDFFKSAWAALKGRYLNIDAPIALALTSVFSVSVYQLLSGIGPGYFDSLTGAVFFMLVGRYFQEKTFSGISFERDYRSYFPVAISVLQEEKETRVPVSNLRKGDVILVRNQELVPADAVLMSADASIDYSFVSGEAAPVHASSGETVFAGGKLNGSSVTLQIIQNVSQSYLTQLWNNDAFRQQKEKPEETLAFRINRYFSVIVLFIATTAAMFWSVKYQAYETAFHAFTTSLLVACPCALVLSATFTNGNLLALFGRYKFYPKNAFALEQLAKIDTIVFDKTGTMTRPEDATAIFSGDHLYDHEWVLVRKLAEQSSHPLSRLIAKSLHAVPETRQVITGFCEVGGAGTEGTFGDTIVRLGSASWAGAETRPDHAHSIVFISINGNARGHFSVRNSYRTGLPAAIRNLRKSGFQTCLLSGDKPSDISFLSSIFKNENALFFGQKPEEKLAFIAKLQQEGRHVLMAGDGLNDAGALRQSDLGLAVSDHVNNFSPACDAIIDGEQLAKLPAYIELARTGQLIIKSSFVISLFYNVFGLYFAVAGVLSPVIAAILMPVSTITIVLFTTTASRIAARVLMKTDQSQ